MVEESERSPEEQVSLIGSPIDPETGVKSPLGGLFSDAVSATSHFGKRLELGKSPN